MVLRLLRLSHLNIVILAAVLHCRVSSLCNQLLLYFSMNVSQTLQRYFVHIEIVHVGFRWS